MEVGGGGTDVKENNCLTKVQVTGKWLSAFSGSSVIRLVGSV